MASASGVAKGREGGEEVEEEAEGEKGLLLLLIPSWGS